MKIVEVKTRQIRIPLVDPKRFAKRTIYFRDYTIVEIISDEGISGMGYCWGTPLVGLVIRKIYRNLLIGENHFDITRLWYKLYHETAVWGRRGINLRAISIIDVALWDLLGKTAGLPIHKLLGGYREKVPCYYSGGYYPLSCTTSSDLLEYLENEMGSAYAKGFRAFKMKVGAESSRLDIERVKLARKIIGDESELYIDANNAWDPDTAIKMGRKFEDYEMKWFEEPVAMDNLSGCAKVAANLNTPIAIGENHFTRWDFKEIIDSKAASIFQGDPTLMGGYTEWLNVAGTAATYGITLAPHWTHDLNIQVCSARPEVMIMEYFEAEDDVFNFQIVLKEPVKAVKGYLYPPNKLGHGLEIDEKVVKKYLLDD